MSSCYNIWGTQAIRNVKVRVLDSKGGPIQGCQIKAFETLNAKTNGFFSEQSTDANGLAIFDIDRALLNSRGALRKFKDSRGRQFKKQETAAVVFKTNCPGYLPSGNFISMYDIQAYLYSKGGQIGDWHYNGEVVIPTYVNADEVERAKPAKCEANIGANLVRDDFESCYFSSSVKQYLNTYFCRYKGQLNVSNLKNLYIVSNGVKTNFSNLNNMCSELSLEYLGKR